MNDPRIIFADEPGTQQTALARRQASTYFSVMTTKDRITDAAMRLFGERGYAATSVALIEQEAGLAPGSGGLYKHFRSKKAVLDAGIRSRIESSDDLLPLIAAVQAAPDRRASLRAIAAAALARLDSERDLNRILVRDLAPFPDLLELFRTAELQRLADALSAGVVQLEPSLPDRARAALSAVFIGAVSHFWLLADIYGGSHPLGIDRNAFLDAVADAADAAIARGSS